MCGFIWILVSISSFKMCWIGQVAEIEVQEVNRFIVVHGQEFAENSHLEHRKEVKVGKKTQYKMTNIKYV